MSVAVATADGSIQLDGQVLIELTKRCNYHCRHCYTDASPWARTPEASPGELATLLESIHRLGFRAVTLSGGEPMLRGDVEEIVAAVPAGLEAWLFTSGLHLGPERLARWRRRLSGYAVSLDGGPARHNALRRNAGAFRQNLGFLRRAALAGARLQLQSMVLRDRTGSLPHLVELAEALDVERILFSHVSPDGRGLGMAAEQMDAAGLDALARTVQDLQRETAVRLHTNLMPRRLIESRFPPPALHVEPDGTVLPWFGVPRRFALGRLADRGWDLEALLGAWTGRAEVEGIFAAAREEARRHPGEAVPVDDLLVERFREPALCA